MWAAEVGPFWDRGGEWARRLIRESGIGHEAGSLANLRSLRSLLGHGPRLTGSAIVITYTLTSVFHVSWDEEQSGQGQGG